MEANVLHFHIYLRQQTHKLEMAMLQLWNHLFYLPDSHYQQSLNKEQALKGQQIFALLINAQLQKGVYLWLKSINTWLLHGVPP